ncbi:MAG TPA: hypothetical protein PKD85_20515 [Saprospiraceae bacterium]|nr:hypothetical protein [Saprospiraceae bacterium]
MESRSNLFFWVIVVILFTACITKKSQLSINNDWNNNILKLLFDQYVDYKKNYSALCPSERNLDYHLIRKERIIKTFEYSSHISLFSKKLKDLNFDSIVTIKLFDLDSQEVDFPYHDIFYFIFNDGKISQHFATSEYKNKISVERINNIDFNLRYSRNVQKNHGCDYGLIVINNLNKKFEITNTKIIINAEDIFNTRQ